MTTYDDKKVSFGPKEWIAVLTILIATVGQWVSMRVSIDTIKDELRDQRQEVRLLVDERQRVARLEEAIEGLRRELRHERSQREGG